MRSRLCEMPFSCSGNSLKRRKSGVNECNVVVGSLPTVTTSVVRCRPSVVAAVALNVNVFALNVLLGDGKNKKICIKKWQVKKNKRQVSRIP